MPGFPTVTNPLKAPVKSLSLSKREHFAAIAMQGLCASGAFWDKKLQNQAESIKSNTSQVIAVSAVDIADELIKELNKTKTK